MYASHKFLIASSVSFVILFGALMFFIFYGGRWSPEENVFCTLEVKICPDGSAVGRIGPNCEFAECPPGVLDFSLYPELTWEPVEGKKWVASVQYEVPLDITQNQGIQLEVYNFFVDEFEKAGYEETDVYEKFSRIEAHFKKESQEIIFVSSRVDTEDCLGSEKNLLGGCNMITEEHFEISSFKFVD